MQKININSLDTHLYSFTEEVCLKCIFTVKPNTDSDNEHFGTNKNRNDERTPFVTTNGLVVGRKVGKEGRFGYRRLNGPYRWESVRQFDRRSSPLTTNQFRSVVLDRDGGH